MDIARTKPAHRTLGKRNAYIGGAVVVIVTLLVSVANLGKAAPSVARAGLWVDRATHGDMVREIRASGVLVPRDVRFVTAGTAANVQEVLIQPGATVRADSIIMRLVNPAVDANLSKAKARQAGAEADFAARRNELLALALEQKAAVASAEAAYEIARVKATSIENAFAGGVMPRIDLDQSLITLKQNQRLLDIAKEREAAFRTNMVAPLGAARAQRDQVTSELVIAQQEADALNVRAGIDGILQQVSVEPGQQVAAGASLAKVAKPAPLVARLQVPQIQANDLTRDLLVLVDTHNGIAEGVIERIDPAVRNGSVLVDVSFKADLPGGARPDLSVDGRVVLDRLQNVISIARPALATANARGTLFVLVPGSDIAERKRVLYGAISSDRVQVLEGIKANDDVILSLSNTSRWSDYEQIRLE